MPDLTREEVERRLEDVSQPGDVRPEFVFWVVRLREALQTAQSLYAQLERQRDSWQREVDITEAERDELKGQCVRWEAMYEGMMAERDGLTVDVERLRWLLREWTDMDPLRYDSEYSACPWCAFDYPNMRHEPDCPFVLARAAVGIGKGGSDA